MANFSCKKIFPRPTH